MTAKSKTDVLAQAEQVRAAVIEECARVCDKHARWAENKITEPPESRASQTFAATSLSANDCAEMIRALAAQPPAAPVEPLVSALQHLNDLGERALLYAQSMPAAPVETAFQSMEDAILFVLKDMRACGSWDAKTMDRVVENVEQIFRSPFLPPLRSSAVKAEVSIVPMALADGRADYFVQIKVGDRAVTPHVFREEYKSAYHVALYDWLLNGNGEEPDCVEFGPNDWPGRVMPDVPQGAPK